MKRALVALLLALAACSHAPPPEDPITGLIVAVKGATMTLRVSDGSTYTFVIDDPSVAVSHLRVHVEQRLPVVVTWRTDGDRLIAGSIADAPPA